jgi:hypothetical protein
MICLQQMFNAFSLCTTHCHHTGTLRSSSRDYQCILAIVTSTLQKPTTDDHQPAQRNSQPTNLTSRTTTSKEEARSCPTNNLSSQPQTAMPPKRRRPPRPGALSDLPPLRIARSILLLQLSYYTTATLLILFTTLVLGQRFAPALILDWRSVRADNTLGWVVGICWVLTGFVT